jgi:hypothetical protein
MKNGFGDYSEEQYEINTAVKERSDWKCIKCGHDHDFKSSHVLTVHHFDMDKGNNEWFNLLPLCQRCHLSVQAKMNVNNINSFNCPHWFFKYYIGMCVRDNCGDVIDESVVDHLVVLFAESLKSIDVLTGNGANGRKKVL